MEFEHSFNMISVIIIFLFFKLTSGNLFNNNTSIITIATGGYSANNLVKSLRTNGKWKKKIYVITDSCTPKIRNTISIKIPNITKTPLQAKRYKMDILKNTLEQYVLFLDSDIKINYNLNYFFRKIKSYDNNCDAYMPHDVHYSKKFIFNSGIILVKRYRSEYFLKIWKDFILDVNYEGNKDQPALHKLVGNNLIKICLIPDSLIYYAPDVLHKSREHSSAIFTHYLKLKSNVKKCF